MGDSHDSWLGKIGVDVDDFVAGASKVAQVGLGMAQSATGGIPGAIIEQGIALAQQAGTAVGGVVKKAVAGATGGGPAAKPGAPAGGGGAAAGAAGGGISGSVGRGGKNNAADVKVVQTALGIAADGKCGPQTITAIENFQKSRGTSKPDGRVDPGGPTLRALLGGGGGGGAPAAPPAPAKPGDEDDGLLSKLSKGAQGLLGDAKELGGKALKGVSDIVDDPAGLGGKLLQGAKGAGGNLGGGALNSSVPLGATPGGTKVEIKIPMGEHELPAGGKLKMTVELSALLNAKVFGIPGTEISVGKDGPGFKVTSKLWESDAKLKIKGVDVFKDPKFELENEANKKEITVRVSFSTQTPIGKITGSFIFFDLKMSNLKSPMVGGFSGKFEGVETKYPDQQIGSVKFTELQITFEGEIKIGLDVVKMVAQKVGEKALEFGSRALLAVGVEVIIVGSFIVGGVATIAGACYQIAFGLALKDMTESFGTNLRSMENGFRAGMSGGAAPGDRYGAEGHKLGVENFKKLVDRTKEQNPNATEDQVRVAISAKADDATKEAINSGVVASSLKNGMWDGLLSSGKWLFTAKDAATAFQACGLGNDPRFDSKAAATPQWKKYLTQYPTQSQL